MTHIPSGPGWVASPIIGVRVAGSAAEDLDALACRASAAALAEHVALTERLRADGAALSDLLHPVIGRFPGGDPKPQLVALRRAVHQGRAPSARAWSAAVREALPPELVPLVEAWLARLARAAEIERQLPDLLADETAAAVVAVRKAVAEPAFRFGLVLGSPALAAAVGDWVDHGRAPRRSSLLRAVKYLARAAAKTSPNASFGFSGLGRWSATGPAATSTRDLRWRGVPELDLHTIGRLWSALATRPELRDRVPVRRNPSVTTAGERVRFLAATRGEPVADIVLTDVLRAVLEHVATSPAPTVGTAVALLAQVTSAPPEKCRTYLDELVALGLVDRGRPYLDQSPDPLAEIAAWAADVPAVATAVRELAAAVDGYPRLPDATARTERLRTVRSLLAQLPGPLPDKDLVRENAVLDGPVVHLGAPQWQPVLADLDLLRALLGVLDPNLAAVSAAAARFVARFGAGARIGFLDFYRECHAAVSEPLPAHLGELRDQALQALFAAPRGADGTIEVDRAALLALAAGWPAIVRPPHSISCFGQAAGHRFVVNAVRTGYGWGTSRIHHLLTVGGAALDPLRPPPAPGSVVLAECPAAFGTTLNVRSPAVPHTIAYPRAEATGGTPVGDLVVEHDAATGRLALRVPGGPEVRPLALGLLVEHLLPPALRFLVRVFGEAQTPFAPHVQLGTAGLCDAVDGIRRRPRLALGAVVLARAVACVPAGLLPRRGKGETDAAFLLRFAHWRARHDLPARCFVRALGGPTWARTHKPLYLDATNPLLLEVVDRALQSLDDADVVAFEEALPDLADAPRYGTHGRRATEYVLEVSADA